MRHFITLLFFSFFTFKMNAQDSVWVQSFNYGSTSRDSVINFPEGDHNQYEKIIMYYSMRCKGGLVSTSADRNKGCGEWDYSCNTSIIDSTAIDSSKAVHPNYIISGFSGSYFPYVTKPTYTYLENVLTNISPTNISGIEKVIINNTTDQVIINQDKLNGKLWLYFTKDELNALGNGTLNGITFQHTGNGKLDFLNIQIAPFNGNPISYDEIAGFNFTEVVDRSVTFDGTGETNVYFHNAYNYMASDGLVFEISYNTSKNSIKNLEIKGHLSSTGAFGLQGNDSYWVTDGQSGVSTNSTLTSIGKEITIAFWSKSASATLANNSFLYGAGSNGERQLNIHLPWSNNRIFWDCGNDGSSYDRIDKSSAGISFNGAWNHWAFTKNTVTGVMKIYLNGELWHSATGKTKPINVKEFTLGASRGNEIPFLGNVDDFTMWSRELKLDEIKTIMHQHPAILQNQQASLIAYYNFDDNINSTIYDLSGNGVHLSTTSDILSQIFRAKDYFKNFNYLTASPSISLLKGQITVSKSNITTLDSIQNIPNKIIPYSVVNRKLVVGQPLYYWEAKSEYIYDESGTIKDSINIDFEDILEISDITYYTFAPSKFELMSFVTPYGIGLDFGIKGKTWTFDVTDFAPILKGKKRFLMDRGGERQEQMDIKFAFIKGTPTRNVLNIQQVWPVNAYGYSSILNNSQLEKRTLSFDNSVKSMKIRTVATGHGQEGEFIPRTHSFNINDGSSEFSWSLWKECANNPIYPQGGTWVYDRAGWCPGAPSDLREFEIMSLVNGNTFTLDYGLNTAEGDSRYIVNTQLVKYGAMNFTRDAAIKDILSPSSKVEYTRSNPACSHPVITVQNNGSSQITDMLIEYGTELQKLTYHWTGNLASLQIVKIELPALLPSIFSKSKAFGVEIKTVNGSADQNIQNNNMVNDIIPVKTMEKGIIVSIKTNSQPQETKWTIKDNAGNILKTSRLNMEANKTYNDTLANIEGCFQLQFTDSDQDGISWWANGDGVGAIRAKAIGSEWMTFNPDFGSEFTFNFISGIPSSAEDGFAQNIDFKIIPNPTYGLSDLIFSNVSGRVVLNVIDQCGKIRTSKEYFASENEVNKIQLDLSALPAGLYFVQISGQNASNAIKMVKY
ncbi:MAG: LamG-like jellyroll fold domain-containing protein [Saprospiraceae bacterium]